MKKLTFKKAAEKVLKETKEPLSAQQITEKALNEELIETAGVTPEATMAAQLYTDIKNNRSSKFIKVGKGLFVLKKQTESAKSPLLAIEKQNELVKSNLMEKIHNMDPFLFEHLVAELLRKIGYENVEVTKRSGDKGVDVNGNLTVGGLTNVKTVIQVKRYKTGNNISGSHITQLRGSAEVDQRGLIITTSDFTKDAVRESKAANKMPVSLVNGQKLIELLLKHQVGVKVDTISVFSIDIEMFDNELSDIAGKHKDTMNKSRVIWPLPGGIYSFISSLEKFLERVKKGNSSRDQLQEWFVKSFDSVNSYKSAASYLNVPRNMGLIDLKDDKFILTENGEEYLQNRNADFLFHVISDNILAFEEVHQFLLNSDEPKSDQEIYEYIVENFDVEWTTLTQVSYRLLWLINLGKVEKTDNGYIGK